MSERCTPTSGPYFDQSELDRILWDATCRTRFVRPDLLNSARISPLATWLAARSCSQVDHESTTEYTMLASYLPAISSSIIPSSLDLIAAKSRPFPLPSTSTTPDRIS